MPLPAPEPRDWLQNRTVDCRGFRRRDGLWEIEGHLYDTRTYSYPSQERGERPAGESVHDIWLRLAVDDEFEIKQVAFAIDSSPWAACREIESAYQQLVGLRIASGWNRRVRELFGGERGCLHVLDLLQVMAGTLVQTVGGQRSRETGRPFNATDVPAARCHVTARFFNSKGGKT